ncbi:protein asteroid homolog 1 [Exaiptasia diaphana]|uniref:PIN domain-containing protein n=1 Tax=Exaiptasia diaphana TaxID=2652724 RepID=A0A913Y9S1_EXADI|nr:protein asteroid homolog 1 [Exaiptasia diaphana]
MGIRLLTTLVDKVPSVWTQEKSLQNTPVIIDGNALMFFLYKQTDCRAGGEFDKFSRDIEKFFANFAGQNVTPYVVLDGATVAVDKKLETVIKRTEDKIETCYNLSKGKSGKSAETKVLSPLAKMTFITKLRSLGIEFTVCDREADQKIAILANQKNCPVISNDRATSLSMIFQKDIYL